MKAGLIVATVAAFFGAVPDLQPGDQATYTDAAGRSWCATVHAIAPGADARPWAWLTLNADPRRVVHDPVADLLPGCPR